jgi:hypothetical protein
MVFLITNKTMTYELILPTLDWRKMSDWHQDSGKGNAKEKEN